MKFATWISAVALLIALASAGVIPQEEEQYLPPVGEGDRPVENAAALADDGYRYKTVRKLRHRRDVSELAESTVLSDDGYHYRAPEPEEPLPPKASNEYLQPPNEDATDVKEVSEPPQVLEEYLPPVEEVAEIIEAPVVTEAPIVLDVPQPSELSNEYLPPVEESKDDTEVVEAPQESAVLADDGYHYRSIRYRRDVSEIVAPASGYLYEAPAYSKKAASVYLPPAEVKEAVPEPSEAPQVANEYLPPSAEVKEAVPEPTEAPQIANEYLPPAAEVKEAPEVVKAPAEIANVYLPPVAEVKEAPEAPADTTVLAEDGYRYKTIRRLKYRHRRDVSEIVTPVIGYLYEAPADTKKVANVYLPPAEVKEAVPEPSEAPQVANEYLPPSAEVKEALLEPTDAPQVSNEYLPPAELKDAPKAINEAPAATEAPITPESPVTIEVPVVTEAPVITEATIVVTEAPAVVTEAPVVVTETPVITEAPKVSNEYLPPSDEVPKLKEASEVPETAVLADDGYHYKANEGFRFRRDVSEVVAPSSGYLYEPPATIDEAANLYLPPVEAKEAAEPSEAEQVSNEYLPPVQESKDDAEVVESPQESAVLADDGYHYKTVRRLKYRQRRDVYEITATKNTPNGYFYPSPVKQAVNTPVEDSAVLADDGYRYRTVRRIRYRHRRDVPEIVNSAANGYVYEAPAASEPVANEYIPPVVQIPEVKNVEAEPVVNEYLPPVEQVPEVKTIEAEPTEAAPEVSSQYLPPAAETRGEAEIVEAPEDSAVLAEDGYRYKTVRRIRYLHRRDVSEIVNSAANGYVYEAPAASEPVANEYIPPVEQIPEVKTVEAEPVVNEYLPPVQQVPEVKAVEAEPTEAAPEVSSQYLPPAEETRGDAEIVEAPEDSAVLAEDGYRYKTVRRIRYLHRRDVSEIVNSAANGYVYEAPAASEPVANEYIPPVEQIPEVKTVEAEPVVNEYLPPVQQVPEVKAVEAEPTEAAPEVSSQYLPPAEETRGDAEIVEAPEDSAVLAEDGYRYKTVRRTR